MCLTAKQRMHGVHAEISDLPLGGHRCAWHKRLEWSVTEKETHARMLLSASTTDDAGYALCIPVGCDGLGLGTRLYAMRNSDTSVVSGTRYASSRAAPTSFTSWRLASDRTLVGAHVALWLRDREYSLRASALKDASCCSWSRFFVCGCVTAHSS